MLRPGYVTLLVILQFKQNELHLKLECTVVLYNTDILSSVLFTFIVSTQKVAL
jgi:hypothetical protein